MPGTARAMTLFTAVALVLVSAYSVALGGNGWLWFGWLVLVLLTTSTWLTRND